MDDSPEVIRQQMSQTRSQLSEKLGSLEQQVSETVQSTGTAVNATVGAVQESVETVTEAVQDAIQSVNNAFDVRHHLDKHPWLFLTGAAALGYLACDLLEDSEKSRRPEQNLPVPPRSSALQPRQNSGNGAAENAVSVPNQSGRQQFTSAATGALIGILQDAARHVVPLVLECLQRNGVEKNAAEAGNRKSGAPAPRFPDRSRTMDG